MSDEWSGDPIDPNEPHRTIWNAINLTFWLSYLIAVAAALVFVCSGCAPEGGTAKARKTQPEQQHDETKPPDPEPQRRRTTPAEFRSAQAKRIDAAFEAYRLGMAKGWRDAASQQPPAKSWDEAYARVKRNNFAEREAAFAPFAEGLDKLTEGKQFSPELFREIADTVAKALEE